MIYSQSGLDLDGLATTIPAAAPDAFDPSAPMFASTPFMETAFWLVMKASREA